MRPLNFAMAGVATLLLLLLLLACTTVEATPRRDVPPGQHRHNAHRHNALSRDDAAARTVRSYSRRDPAPTSPSDSHTMDHLPGWSALPGGGAPASHHVDETAPCPDVMLPRFGDCDSRLARVALLRHSDHSYARGARAPPRSCARDYPVC